MTAAFQGFPEEAFAFLSGLAENNRREWFEDNRRTYEQSVKAPAAAFEAALCSALGAATGIPMASKTFRINRDVRFSKDKRPYEPFLRFAAWPSDGIFRNKQAHPPSFFLLLGPDRLKQGVGMMTFEKDMLDRYCRRVAETSDGDMLAGLIAGLAAAGFRLRDPDLARVPAGFSADHRHAALLKQKGLGVWRDEPRPKEMTTPGAVAFCVERFLPARGVFEWLREL